jgi:hypothetical protein
MKGVFKVFLGSTGLGVRCPLQKIDRLEPISSGKRNLWAKTAAPLELDRSFSTQNGWRVGFQRLQGFPSVRER